MGCSLGLLDKSVYTLLPLGGETVLGYLDVFSGRVDRDRVYPEDFGGEGGGTCSREWVEDAAGDWGVRKYTGNLNLRQPTYP